mmetsp:Transcript_19437/g.57609  ORF Transcript_19437/g.57609 Transcript_19437/m.57609 type:complete len:450 (-) Transcript_19437:88-1437(-)
MHVVEARVEVGHAVLAEREAVAHELAAKEDEGVVLRAVHALQILVERRVILRPDGLHEARASALEAAARNAGARAAHPAKQREGFALHLAEVLEVRIGQAVDAGAILLARTACLRVREPGGELALRHGARLQLEAVPDELAADVDVGVHLHRADGLVRVEALQVRPERVGGVRPRDRVKARVCPLEPRHGRVCATHVRHSQQRHRLGADCLLHLGDPRRVHQGLFGRARRRQGRACRSDGQQRVNQGDLPEDDAHSRVESLRRTLAAKFLRLCGGLRALFLFPRSEHPHDDPVVVGAVRSGQLSCGASQLGRGWPISSGQGLRAFSKGGAIGLSQLRGVEARIAVDEKVKSSFSRCGRDGLGVDLEEILRVADAWRAAVVGDAGDTVSRQGRKRVLPTVRLAWNDWRSTDRTKAAKEQFNFGRLQVRRLVENPRRPEVRGGVAVARLED